MFFVLSKVLLFLLQPLNWVVGCLLYGIWGRGKRWRKRALLAGVILLLVFTNPLLGWLAYRAWEVAPVRMAGIEAPYDVGIVLGGFSNSMVEPRDRLHFNGDASRLTQAVELFREGKIRRILISGGSGVLIGEKVGEAAPAKRFLLRVGIPEEAVLIDNDSRNTRENAVNSAELLRRVFGDDEPRCLLVTSAFHMRRAQGCFRKAGVVVTPFSTSVRSVKIRAWTPAAVILPSASALDYWNVLIKEWVGMVVYRVRGYV